MPFAAMAASTTLNAGYGRVGPCRLPEVCLTHDASPPLSRSLLRGWACTHEIDVVLFTALPPKWNGENYRTPSEREMLAYLGSLSGPQRKSAEEYVRRTPTQIRTPFRAAIEEQFGWTPT
jgi:hypothetical protein